MAYLEIYTVPRLREIATRMEIPHTTKTRKPELVAAIAARIDFEHGSEYARVMQEQHRPAEPEDSYTLPGTGATWTGPLATEMRKHVRKVENYHRQNGTKKLTPAQRRRLRKNSNRRLGGILAGM